MPKPMEYTLWLHCFYKEAESCRKKGADTVQFADVDKRVIKMSKALTEFPLPEDENEDD